MIPVEGITSVLPPTKGDRGVKTLVVAQLSLLALGVDSSGFLLVSGAWSVSAGVVFSYLGNQSTSSEAP